MAPQLATSMPQTSAPDHKNASNPRNRPPLATFHFAKLNRYLVSHTLVFLDEAERQNLGRAFPVFFQQLRLFRPQPAPQQQKQQQQQQDTPVLGRPPQQQLQPSTNTIAPILMITDPHTLLARLNTRRLYRRLKYLKQQQQSSSTQELLHAESGCEGEYPTPIQRNHSTEQIAILEWQALVKQKPAAATTTTKDEKPPPPLPSPYELLLFSPCPHPVTVLASYPRSGNSLLRNLFERTTLRVTGSDMRGNLLQHDLVGEAAVSTGMVQFVKTHFPERRGSPCFPARRAVLLVRNPYDAIESYFHLMMTSTHTKTIDENVRREHQKLWEDMVLKEILVWRDFHEYWLQRPNNIPILVIRYEDLIRFTGKVAAKAVEFILEVKDMRFFQRRIDQCILEEQLEQLGPYKPRSGGIGKSLEKYSPELLQQMNTMGIIATMEKLGYGEMLVPNPAEWDLEPLDEYGVELSSEEDEQPNNVPPVVAINAGKLVRDQGRMTDWKKVRQALHGIDSSISTRCTCYRCIQAAR